MLSAELSQESNRVCVALSRAKIPFYLIGNLDFLASKSELWTKIRDSLQAIEAVGVTLPVVCLRHGNKQVVILDSRFTDKDARRIMEQATIAFVINVCLILEYQVVSY